MKIKIKEKKYKDNVILKNTEFSMFNGIYLLVGENGSGKTTFFNILYKEDTDFEGEIEYNNKDIKDYKKDYYRKNICSYFTQDSNFFDDLNIEDIIELFLGNRKEEQVDDLLNKFRLNDLKNKKYSKLSGGEKQKIRLILILLSDNSVYLIDEPENNLDQETVNILINYIEEQGQGKIIVISSHKMLKQFNNEKIKVLNIENQMIKLEDNKEIEFEKKDEQKVTNIDRTIKNKLIKKLNKRLLFPTLLISFIILLFCLTLSILISFLSYDIWRADTNNKDAFGEVSTVIYPPIYNYFFDEFGTEEWLEKHDAYFTVDDYNKLLSLDYVKEVEPIKPWNEVVVHPYTPDEYILGPELDYSQLDYEKYGLSQYRLENDKVPLEYAQLLSEKETLENLPYYHYSPASISDIIYGDIPEDGTDEIMVDIYLAMYMSEQYGLESIEDLIDKKVEISAIKVSDYKKSFSDYDTDLIEKKEYIVSGIYVPEEYVATSQVVAAYDPNSVISQKNNYGFTNDKINDVSKLQYVYPAVAADNENVGRDFMSIEDFEKKYPDNRYFTGFYVEVENEDDLEKLTKAVEENDKYIEVDNNYTIANSNNYKYLVKDIRSKVIMILVLQILEVIVIFFLWKYYKFRNSKTISLLEFYSFDNKSIEMVKKNAFLKLLKVNILFLIIMNFIFLLITDYKMIGIFTGEYIVVVVVLIFLYIRYKRGK